jgi:hypothetical protein
MTDATRLSSSVTRLGPSLLRICGGTSRPAFVIGADAFSGACAVPSANSLVSSAELERTELYGTDSNDSHIRRPEGSAACNRVVAAGAYEAPFTCRRRLVRT